MNNNKHYKVECSTVWGTPCLVDEYEVMEGSLVGKFRAITNTEDYEVEVLGNWYNFKVIPVGSKSNMGHGCGSGYTASCVKLDSGYELTGDVTIRLKEAK